MPSKTESSATASAGTASAFGWSPEQNQLRDSVERFVRQAYDVESWRRAAYGEAGFSEDNWRTMADMGWLGVCVPEVAGGLGLGVRERCIIGEGLGRAPVLEPFWSTAVMGVELIRAAACAARQQQILPGVADGSTRLAVALYEPGQRYQWEEAECSAVRADGGYVLTGRKIAVLDAPSAAQLLVLARTSGAVHDREGLSLFLVGIDAPGVRRRDFMALDGRRCSDIAFGGVALPASGCLGAEGTAAAAVERAVEHGLLALCAEAVGAMDAVIALCVEHLKTRTQFGKPLASFQALRHRVADMVMAVEQCRSLTLKAAACLEDGDPQAPALVSAAKVQAGTAGRLVGESGVQLHGGIGLTDELHAGHYLKRLTVIDVLLGDASFHLDRFTRLRNDGTEPVRTHARAMADEPAAL